MGATLTMPIPPMSWDQNDADERRFRIISIISILLALLLGATLNLVHIPAPERRDEVIPPHLAQIIMERKKEPPKIERPKPVEPEKLKPEDIKKESKKAEETPQPKPVTAKPEPVVSEPQPQPQPQQPQSEEPRVKNVEAARQKAASSGVLAMKDMLADMRESEPAQAIQQQSTQQLQSGGSEASAPSRSILTAKASKGSGGIDTSKFSRDTGGKTALAGHDTATVVSRLDSLPAAQAQKREEQEAKQTSGRSEAEIQRTMEANKGALYSIYQRALRQNPAMQGKVVVKITIAASGEVTDCTVISSELGDPDLERKLALRIKRIDFGAKNAEVTSITYPIDFLPNL